MIPLVYSIWMSCTPASGHSPDTAEFKATVFTGILRFLCSFINFVITFVWA